jgi:hypothetical protein
MAIAFVQGANNTSQSGTAVTLAFGSNNAGGNLLICTVRGTQDASSITDSAGNNWVQIDHLQNTEWGSLWYAQNSISGANTVTVHFGSSASFVYLAIGEYSGVATSLALDSHNITSGTSAGATAPTVTAAAGDLVVGYVEVGNGDTISAGSGYTIRENNIGAAYEDQLNVSAGNYAPNFTWASSDRWVAGVATFKVASPPSAFVGMVLKKRNRFYSTPATPAAPRSYTFYISAEKII